MSTPAMNGAPLEDVVGNSDNMYFNKNDNLVNKSGKEFKYKQKEHAYVLCYKNIKARVVRLTDKNVILTIRSLESTKPGRELLNDVNKYTLLESHEKNTYARKYNGAFSLEDKYIIVPLWEVSDE